MTQEQKKIIENYVLDLIGLVDQEELQFVPGSLLFKTEDNIPLIVRGIIVKNSDQTFGVVKDGMFYEGQELYDGFELLNEPTKIEELI